MSIEGSEKIVEVVVGLIPNQKGELVIAQRNGDRHLSGLWEFPGGKVEAGESYLDALSRELFEEVGVQLNKAIPFQRLDYRYPQKRVRLLVYYLTDWVGNVLGREGQQVKWSSIAELQHYTFPEANRPIIHRLQLLPLVAITPPELTPSYASSQQLLSWMGENLNNGVEQFLLRLPNYSTKEIAKLGATLVEALEGRSFKLLVASRGELVSQEAISQVPGWVRGIHFSAHDLFLLHQNLDEKVLVDINPNDRPLLFGASCHNADELKLAEEIDVDYATLSPIKLTKSHPGAKLMGWTKFKELASGSWLPCLALGGVAQQDYQYAVKNGAFGIAGISTFSNG